MQVENAVVEKPVEEQRQKKEPEKAPERLALKAILIKKGQHTLANSLVLPSFDVCLLGEQGTVLAPQPNVLPILGVGNKDVKCRKCGYTLAMKIKRPQLQNLAIKCPSCGHVNEL